MKLRQKGSGAELAPTVRVKHCWKPSKPVPNFVEEGQDICLGFAFGSLNIDSIEPTEIVNEDQDVPIPVLGGRIDQKHIGVEGVERERSVWKGV